MSGRVRKKPVVGARVLLLTVNFLALSLWHAPVFAVDPQKAITQYAHYVWRAEDGLSQKDILSITQTRDGYLWLATLEGLLRFDGVRFTVFDKTNTSELRQSYIWTLFQDRAGSLWIGTYGGGLTRYHEGKFTTYTTAEGLAHNMVRAISEGRDGSLWIGTNSGLSRFKDGKFTTYTTREGLSNDYVRAVYEDQHGQLWVGTTNGLDQFKDGRFVRYYTVDELGQHNVKPVHAIGESRDGSLWFGLYGGGLNRLKDGKLTAYTSKQGLSNDLITALYEDRAGSLWVGTHGGGLNRFQGSKFTAYTKQQGLSHNSVVSIYEDREGNLWVGTLGHGGLNRFRDGKFATYTTQEGLGGERTWSIAEGKDGSIWIGTEGGALNHFKKGRFTVYRNQDWPANSVLRSVYVSHDGGVWIGTEGGGLSYFKDGRFTTYTTKQGLSANTVWALCEDEAGSLWIGTEGGGLNRFQEGKFTVYTRKDGLPGDVVRAIYRGRDGSLWLGTNGGLGRLKDGAFIAHTTKDGLSSDMVRSIYEDQESTLWVGTLGGGLNRFRNGKFTAFPASAGLFDDVIWCILEDDRGNLWMNCNKGIFQVRKQDLHDFAEGRIRSLTSRAYDMADGLKGGSSGGSYPAGLKASDGRLWFPTVNGAVAVAPNDIKLNQLLPPVLIEQVLSAKQAIALNQGAQLPPSSGELEFHYTALSLLAPEKVRFRYKLEGFDQEWIEAGARRVAYYTNIPPGTYRFRVMASNNDGLWNEAGASFDFYLAPRFYQTYWFYGLCAFALALAGAGLYCQRIRQLKARERELARRVDERTQELRQAEEKYRGIFEESIAGIFQTTPDGSYLSVNPALARMHGYASPEELMAERTDIERQVYVDPRRRKEFKRLMEAQGMVEQFEYEIYRRDGSQIWLSENARAVRDAQGAVVCYIGTIEDITERKRAAEEILASERKYRTLFDWIADPILIIDKETRHFLDCNQTASKVYGYDKAEFHALTPLELHPPEERALVEQRLDVRSDGQLTHTHVTRDGRRMDVTLHSAEIEYHGRPAWITIVRDMTEHKRAAVELRKAKETAEAATRAKSEFLANMSHEIRTPMNAVIGMTGLLLDTALTDEQREFVETIRTGGDSLLTIINDILDFSKIESGRLDLEQQPFCLSDCMEEALDLVAAKAADKGLELAYLFSDGTPQMIIGDITRLRQILVNLLSNAVKFTDTGEIVMSVEPRPPAGPQLELHFAVRDTGIGIPADKMDRLFRSFSQVDSSTTRHYGGTGLGLAISQRLSEMMGGRMWVESEPGSGSTFHFTIRAEAAPAQPRPYFNRAQPQLASRRLLIVDDNATNRRILTLQAQAWGMRAEAFASGSEALASLRRGDAYDLAILDLQMPGMDGLMLAAEIRKLPMAAALPLVLLSSGLISRRKAESDYGGQLFAAFLAKPIKPSQLFEVVSEIFTGQAVTSAPALPRADQQMAERLPLRILLAEDNVVNQKVALRLLERLGYRADLAGNGLEVLAALQRQRYDVVFMDVQMPELDGLEATRQIRRQWDQSQQPRIVAMTANAMQGDREQCLAAGMDDYVSKPVQIADLQAALERSAQCLPHHQAEAALPNSRG
jgi:PAS domain S-box-containing protein